MMMADLGRALLLASVPIFAYLRLLSVTHLIVVAACAGLLTVLFDVAYQSYLPSLVGSENLLEGNRLLSISSATAEIAGPPLTGVLVQLISAPLAILLDAASFLISGISVWSIRSPEFPPQPSSHVSFRDEMLAGMRVILAHPTLRALLFRSVMASVSMGAVFSFYVLYAIRTLHLSPASLGVVIAFGGLGSLAGGLLIGWAAQRFSPKPTFFASAVVVGAVQMLLPLASHWPHEAVLFLCANQFAGNCAMTFYFVNETTLRRSAVPPHLLGRVNAAMQFASRGMLPIGAILSGFTANDLGIVNTLWIALRRSCYKMPAMRKTGLFLLLCLMCMAFESPSHQATQADVDRWMTELSNWGRWGKNDQIGTVNLITPAKRKQAAALVQEGYSVSLAHNTETEQAADNSSPFGHKMLATGAHPAGQFVVDEYKVSYHGFAHTHMDALCHMAWQGKMYNNFPQTDVTDQGAKELPVTGYKNGIFTRGILIDIPQLRHAAFLEPGAAIYPEDLEAWEKKAGITVSSGDVVFIRTGRWARRTAKGPWNPDHIAGLHASCAKWLKQRDVAMVGSDAATDVMPSGVPDVVQPMHQLLLVAMGTPIFDNCDLEAIAAAAKQRNRWEFLLTAAPIPVPGGTGSPLNPIATF